MANVFWGVQGAMAAEVNADVLLIGDSWFWYPVDNLANEMAAALTGRNFVVVGYNGAEAAQWSDKYRKDIDHGFRMYGAGVKALLLSGGGNDIAGMSDFLRLIKDDCSNAKAVQECYREGQPEAIISKIIAAYREVILRFRAYNSAATVVMHNYDYAWPSGKGLFGPSDWLKAPMDKARVPVLLRRLLFKDLIDRLRQAQLNLKREKALGPLVAVASAGTMPEQSEGIDQWWANELHPTPRGFKLLVQKAFLPELRKLQIT